MSAVIPDHYATLGVDRGCLDEQIRAAYRVMAKRHHPDVNSGSPESMACIQRLNAAYEVLGNGVRRQRYDQELDQAGKVLAVRSAAKTITHSIQLKLQDFLSGHSCELAIRDPAGLGQVETYTLVIPSYTAPGTRIRLKRAAPGGRGWVVVRLKARPDFRFKVRGSDLRCDLKINARRALSGGQESIRGLTGQALRVQFPPHVACGHTVRLAGEGLPKNRGGRGDLLVRITYRPEIQLAQGKRL